MTKRTLVEKLRRTVESGGPLINKMLGLELKILAHEHDYEQRTLEIIRLENDLKILRSEYAKLIHDNDRLMTLLVQYMNEGKVQEGDF